MEPKVYYRVVICVVQILLSCGVLCQDQCPQYCTCLHGFSIVDCSNSGGKLKTIPTNIPTAVEVLVLDNIPLKYIPSKSFVNLTKVAELRLQNCNLSSIAPDAFYGMGALSTLALSMNQLRQLPADIIPVKSELRYLFLSFNIHLTWESIAPSLSGLSSLDTLDVSHTNIGSDTQLPDVFTELESLKILKMDFNTLELGPSYFSSLSNVSLTNLSLESCNLSNVTATALSALTELKFFSLKQSNVKRYEDAQNLMDGLANATNLEQLHMDYMFPKTHWTIDKTFFQALSETSLKSLTFTGNVGAFGGTIPHKFFKSLHSLKELRLDDCGLHSIPESVFQHSRRLKYLYLSGNLLSCFHEEDCGFLKQRHGMENVLTLDLSWNNLQTKNSNVKFISSVFKRLTNLILTGNKIIHLRSKMFNSLQHLFFLDISENPITTIENDWMWGLENLNNLYLNASYPLGRLGAKIFQGARKLQYLHLEESGLDSIHPLTFKGLRRLQKLSLRDNNLDCESVKGVKLDSPNITTIDIGNNFFAQVPDFISTQVNLQHLYMDYNYVTDISALSNLTNLNVLDLSYNSITHIPDGFFTREHSKLQKTSLRGNPFNCGCDFDSMATFKNQSNVTIGMPENHLCHSPENVKGQNIFKFHPSHWDCHAKQVAVPFICMLFTLLVCGILVILQKSGCQGPHIECSRDCCSNCYLPLKQNGDLNCGDEDSRL